MADVEGRTGELEKRVRALEAAELGKRVGALEGASAWGVAWRIGLLAVPLAAAVLLGLQHLIVTPSDAVRLSPEQVAGISADQIKAVRGLVEASFRDEVSSYRAIAAYLKIALPVVLTGILALAWLVVRSHVDARTAEALVTIREKAADDVRQLLKDKTEALTAVEARLHDTLAKVELSNRADSTFQAVQVDVNLSYALWSAGASDRAAQYADRAIKRLAALDPQKPEHVNLIGRALRLRADAAYYHAEHYHKTKDSEAIRPALDHLTAVFKGIAEGELNDWQIDAVLFVVSRVSPYADGHREACKQLYSQNRERLELYLRESSPLRAEELLRSYLLFFS